MRSWLLVFLGVILSALIVSGVIYFNKVSPQAPVAEATSTPASGAPTSAPSPSGSPSAPISVGQATEIAAPAPGNNGASNPNPDLTVDANGLSKATVIMTTSEGVIKFKFYPNDAPKTVKRLIELINKGFYTGLTFHRVVPGFVIQGGDPSGNGTGGSGQKLDAEFNNRRHVEGTVAMARAADPNSADSQFYISLGTHPHLDHNYTIFGQVTEGMDVAKKIKVGDKIMSIVIQ